MTRVIEAVEEAEQMIQVLPDGSREWRWLMCPGWVLQWATMPEMS